MCWFSRTRLARGGDDPQIDGKEPLLAAFGGSLPPVMWDGLSQEGVPSLAIAAGVDGWSLNLKRLGQPLSDAQPGPLMLEPVEAELMLEPFGAPDELEARLK